MTAAELAGKSEQQIEADRDDDEKLPVVMNAFIRYGSRNANRDSIAVVFSNDGADCLLSGTE